MSSRENVAFVIRNEVDLQDARERLRAERHRAVEYRRQLEASRLPPEDVEKALQPVAAFAAQLEQEIQLYMETRTGRVEPLTDFGGLGKALVSLRIAAGLTQRELATRLGVHESMVSRDERNEYQGLTVPRAAQVLDALGVQVTCTFRIAGRPSHEGESA